MVRVLVQQLEEVTDSKLLAYNGQMENNCREMFDLLTSTVLARTRMWLVSCASFVSRLLCIRIYPSETIHHLHLCLYVLICAP